MLSTAEDIAADPTRIVGVCGTTDPHNPSDQKFVYLGGRGQVTNAANLPEPTWVNTEWHHTFAMNEIESPGEVVSKVQRAEIVRKTGALYAQFMRERAK